MKKGFMAGFASFAILAFTACIGEKDKDGNTAAGCEQAKSLADRLLCAQQGTPSPSPSQPAMPSTSPSSSPSPSPSPSETLGVSCNSSTNLIHQPAGDAVFTGGFLVAQSFVAPSTMPLESVEIYLNGGDSGEDGTARLQVALFPDVGANPDSGQIIALASASAFTSSYGWVPAAFGTRPVLEAGQKYWLVLNWLMSAGDYIQVMTASLYQNGGADPYNEGTLRYFYNGTWTEISYRDLTFRVNVCMGGS